LSRLIASIAATSLPAALARGRQMGLRTINCNALGPRVGAREASARIIASPTTWRRRAALMLGALGVGELPGKGISPLYGCHRRKIGLPRIPSETELLMTFHGFKSGRSSPLKYAANQGFNGLQANPVAVKKQK
jgi:hypothetical protein